MRFFFLNESTAVEIRQYQPINPWQAVVIYPNRNVDVAETRSYVELLESPRIK